MNSHDHSLKYLIAQAPDDFIGFALGAFPVALGRKRRRRPVKVVVRGTIPVALPARGRDVDAGHLIEVDDELAIAHSEFHRRHQSLTDLAVDVAEAEIRLYRRERLRVLSLVWDLYGNPDEPVLEDRVFSFGMPLGRSCSQGVYRRINLRGLQARELLEQGPPSLWALSPLTRDGATEEKVQRSVEAIQGRAELRPAQRADHLAVLWFLAEAENVPIQVMQAYISREVLMESALYRSIFEEGEAKGMTRKEVEAILRILTHRLGSVDPMVRKQVHGASDADVLNAWYEEALLATDADAARRLADKIKHASLR